MFTSLDFGDHEKTRVQFCRDLRRHVLCVYGKAGQEARTLYEAAGQIWQEARAVRSPRRPHRMQERHSRAEEQEGVASDSFWDYLMRAEDAAETASFYYQAFLYVRELRPAEINLADKSIRMIALGYLSHWKLQRLKEMRSMASALGWAVTIRTLENAAHADDEAIRDALQFDDADDADYYDDGSEDESDDDDYEAVDEEMGLWAVYSTIPTLTLENAATQDEGEEDGREPERVDEAPAPAALETLIERSPHHRIVAPIAREFLEMAGLISEVELRRTRQAIYQTLSWFHERREINGEDFRQEVNDLLDEKARELEYRFPPLFQRHTSGHGQFMRALLEYEGVFSQSETLDIADAV